MEIRFNLGKYHIRMNSRTISILRCCRRRAPFAPSDLLSSRTEESTGTTENHEPGPENLGNCYEAKNGQITIGGNFWTIKKLSPFWSCAVGHNSQWKDNSKEKTNKHKNNKKWRTNMAADR